MCGFVSGSFFFECAILHRENVAEIIHNMDPMGYEWILPGTCSFHHSHLVKIQPISMAEIFKRVSRGEISPY